jgi:hypothetical protein
MAAIRDVVFDARHPASIARFWAAALDGYDVAPYDDEELERLRAKGVDDPEDDPTVVIVSTSDPRRLLFQLVPEAKSLKNRVHLDLVAADVDAEADRLVTMGARKLSVHESWVTLADPEGNEFCLSPRRT